MLVLEHQMQAPPAQFILPEAQVEELRIRWELYRTPQPKFRPGELIQPKKGVCDLNNDLQDKSIFMFWRYLKMRKFQHREIVKETISVRNSHSRYNCQVATISPHYGDMIFIVTDAAFFTRYVHGKDVPMRTENGSAV